MHFTVVEFVRGIIIINRLPCSEKVKEQLKNQLIERQIRESSNPKNI